MILLCGIAGAIVGALVGLPALRIKGIYLLLATLGFHYLMNFLFLKYQVTWFGYGAVDFARPASISATRSTPRSAGTTSCSGSPSSASS